MTQDQKYLKDLVSRIGPSAALALVEEAIANERRLITQGIKTLKAYRRKTA